VAAPLPAVPAPVPAAPVAPVAFVAPVASVPVAPVAAVPAALAAPGPEAASVPEAPDVAVDALREMLKAAPPKQIVAVGVPTFWRVAALALAVVAVAEGGFIGWKLLGGGRGTGTAPGNVRLDSKPEGAQVKIDGQNNGVTPLSTSLSPGAHVLELSTGGEPRVIPITINARETLRQ